MPYLSPENCSTIVVAIASLAALFFSRSFVTWLMTARKPEAMSKEKQYFLI
jgi:hypothetical protein